MQYELKSVKKFNNLIALFLKYLLQCCPENKNLNDAAVFVSAAICFDPETTKIIDKFIEAFKGCIDYISSRNTDIVDKMNESLITKKDVIEICQKLTEEQQGIAWNFVDKLYQRSLKACPELENHDFDFESLNKHVQQITTTVAIQKKKSKTGTKTSLMMDAFRNACVTLVQIIQQQYKTEPKIVETANEMLASLGDATLDQMMTAMDNTFPSEFTADLVGSTEITLRKYGVPFFKFLPDLDYTPELLQAAMQVGTFYTSVSCVDDKKLVQLESIASKLADQVNSGQLDIDIRNPMKLLADISKMDVGNDLMKILQGL